jgi:cobalt-zinc-cadmium efflux system outer membrane protein
LRIADGKTNPQSAIEGPGPRSPLGLTDVVRYALQNNPQLAAIRQQHGIAAAGVVIGRTYPYNPILQSTILPNFGPESAGITSAVTNQHKVTLDVEIRGQFWFRKQAAFAALTRTDWDIASQEVTFAVNAVRAFDALLYRQAKLAVIEEFVTLNRDAAEQVRKLVETGTLRPAELILARAEVNDIESQVGLGRTAVVAARRDFARALGVTDITAFSPQGTLDRPAPTTDAQVLVRAALEHRPDLFARRAALAEAEARLRLQIADRYGNPTVGPVYEYDDSRVNYVGVQVGGPIPIFNHRPGEILQRRAERAQAALFLRQTEVEIQQDVAGAFGRVVEARAWVEKYQKQVLPDLQKSFDDINRLFRDGQPGVDVLRVIDVRRRLLRARDGYQDALLGYTQALCDLAAAVGDPAVAMGLYEPCLAGAQQAAGPPGCVTGAQENPCPSSREPLRVPASTTSEVFHGVLPPAPVPADSSSSGRR